MDKVVITAALCGAGTFKWNNENVPYVPEEFAAEARKCYEAGVAIVHIHGRDPDTGMPTPDLEITKRIIDAVRDAAPELIINMSTAIAPGLEPEARIEPVRDNLPDMASFNTASMNFALVDHKDNSIITEIIFENTFSTMRFFAENLIEFKVKPEFELYDFGGFYNIQLLDKQGDFFEPPHHYQLVFGVTGGVPFTPMTFSSFLSLLPPEATWSVCGVGREQIRAGMCAAVNGGHVRVGLEDNTRTETGEMAKGSYEQVEWAVRIVKAAGRDVATPGEAKQILSLPSREG
ncbi:3-keto-5-aminohexanoate cleavage protein [Thermodesulfobacteriota bacterium]